MSFDVGAFGWHATVFVTWTSLAILAVMVVVVSAVVKVLLTRAT